MHKTSTEALREAHLLFKFQNFSKDKSRSGCNVSQSIWIETETSPEKMVEARLCVLPLLLLWAGPAAVLLAHLSLGQFKLFYSALEHLSRKSDGFWKFTQPGAPPSQLKFFHRPEHCLLPY